MYTSDGKSAVNRISTELVVERKSRFDFQDLGEFIDLNFITACKIYIEVIISINS